MTPKQFKAVVELREMKNLLFRKSDKGGLVVVMDVDLYCKQALDMLQDENTYRVLKNDPTTIFSAQLEQLLDDGFSINVFTEKEKKYLLPLYPVTPIFHGLPKSHKNAFPPALRPIISGIGSLCENLSCWVDIHLQSMVQSSVGYL